MNTLLLSSGWDLTVDSQGNIATAYGLPNGELYALAQDVASTWRLFLGELWYDTTQGIPYFAQILGYMPPLALVQGALVAAALTVPGVASCSVSFASMTSRTLKGTGTITAASGQQATLAVNVSGDQLTVTIQ